MTFRKIRFESMVIRTNCTEMSFHEAVEGQAISGFYGGLHYVGMARGEHTVHAHYARSSYIQDYRTMTINNV